MIKITGETPEIRRIQTGWYSFDHALADQTEIGYPLGQICEVYGPNGTGKSTTVQSLALVLARETKANIAFADFEGMNVKILTANAELQKFDGEFHRIQSRKDEEILQELLDCMKKKQYSVGIVDAVGSISPASESEGDLGDANMGRRAFLMAQFSRRINHTLIEHAEKSMILINHQHPRIGMIGTITPGGETKKYSASMRIQITRMYRKNKEDVFNDGSYVIKGVVQKNRWGFEDRAFYLFVLAGKGVHSGLTAMYDTIMLKLSTVDRNIVKLGDENIGHINEIIKQAHEGNNVFFEPFYKALETVNGVEIVEEKDEEDD